MKKVLVWCLIFSFFITTTPLPAQTPPAPEAPKPTVAILPFDVGPGIDPGARMALTEELQNNLFETGAWKLINQAEMDKILRQHNFNLSGCTSSECAVKVGEILQVQKIFTGAVTLLGSTYSVTIRLTDVETGTVERIVSEKCPNCKIDELFKLVNRLAYDISGPSHAEGPTPPPTLGAGVVEIITDPPGASIYLDAQLAGQSPSTLKDIPSGPHNLILVLEGHQNIAKKIIVGRNRTTKVNEMFVEITGTLDLKTDPEGAAVLIDGKQVGKTPYVGEVGIGTHKLGIQLPDYQPIEQSVTISYQQKTTLSLRLTPNPGRLLVTSTPSGATVSIDGVIKGKTPLSGIELAVGQHKVAASLEGYQTEEKEITVTANAALNVDFSLQRAAPPPPQTVAQSPPPQTAAKATKPFYKKWWVWAIAGAVIAGGAAAAASGGKGGGGGGGGGGGTGNIGVSWTP